MSKKQQFSKNIKLSEKLANFLASSPESLKKIKGLSVVTFSAKDKELNKANNQLVNKLIKSGKKVVKAEETSSNKNPFTFTSVLS